MKINQIKKELKKESSSKVFDGYEVIRQKANIPQNANLQTKENTKNRSKRDFFVKRLVPVCASFALIIALVVGISMFTPKNSVNKNYKTTYVTLSVNPSLAIEVEDNKVTTVIGLNEEAQLMLKGMRLTDKSYEEVISIILEEIDSHGYFQNNFEIKISVINDNSQAELEHKQAVVNTVQTFIEQKATDISLVISEVTEKAKQEAEKIGISPSKMQYIYDISKETGKNLDKLKEKGCMELIKIHEHYEDFSESFKELDRHIEELEEKYEKELEKYEEDFEKLEDFIEDAEDYIEHGGQKLYDKIITRFEELSAKHEYIKTLFPNGIKDIINSELFVLAVGTLGEFVDQVEDILDRLEDEYEDALEELKKDYFDKLNNNQ